MQRLQVDCSNTGDGSCVLASITVDDLGSAGSLDIPNLRVHIDSDTNFGNGTLGTVVQSGFTGSSTVVSLLSLSQAVRTISFGTPKYIWITYDTASSAQGKTIQSSVTAIAVDPPDNGTTGTWNSNLINVTSGPASTIGSCAGCHDYPALTDSATRDAAAGTFVGDHAKHNYVCSKCHVTPATESSTDYAHRNGMIDMAVPVNNAGGTYSLGSSFPQRNNYVATPTGTCSNINCHNGTITPQWGVGTTTCNSCHNTPPATDAHVKHYTSKGWANDTANCTVCHPNNNTTHSTVDGIVTVNGTLIPSGPPNITCGSTLATGCHNGQPTPAWNTTGITCTQCHTAGGGASGDPTSGLHNTTAVMAHDNQFRNTPGEVLPGTATCLSCHSTAPSSLHFDGTVQNSSGATYGWNTSKIPAGYNRPSDACAATCHTDNATWNRVWQNVTDAAWAYGNDAATAPVCGNCHGSFATGWNIVGETGHDNPAAANDPDTLATSKDSHGECSKCHGWGHSNYSGSSMHVNNNVEMNSTLGYTNATGGCSTNCHAGLTLNMNTNSGWTTTTVAGDGVACGDCHTGGVQPGSASAAHAAHGASPAQLVAGGAACVPCHGNNGGLGFQSTLAGTHGIGNAVNWATNLTYSQAATRGNLTGTCSGTAGCHVATTNIAWNAAQSNCNQCHYSTADTPNWAWTGTAGNISMISSTEFTAVGHGQATINGAAANKGCMDCHDIAVAHDKTATLTGANPFRLKSGFSCNNIAAGCHTVSGLYATHEQATAGKNYTWSFGAKCVDCHDPHGDGSNLAMIRSDLADKGSQANWVRNAPDAAIEPMVFTSTAGTAADSYAEPATAFDGICQECHTLTTSFRDNTSAASGTHSSNTTGCMNCHNHKNDGFKGAGCNGCHGGDYTTGTAGDWNGKNFWPSAGASYPKRGGDHAVHITRLMTKLGYSATTITDQQQLTMCAYCHTYTTAPGEGGHDDNVAPANVGSFDQIWATLSGNYPVFADIAPASGYSGGNGTGGSCSGIDCHNNNTTPATHEWYDGATSTCTMCHVAGGTGIVDPLSGLHKPGTLTSSTPHDDSFAGTGNCTTCHSALSAVGSGDHANGVNNGNAVASLGLTAGMYTQTSATGNGAGTCSGGSVSAGACHGIDPIDAGSWARLWNDTISYANNGTTECAGCHGGFGSNDWTFGGDNVVGDNSVSHARDWDGASSSNDGAEVIGNHSGSTQATKCNICHVYGDGAYVFGTNHRDRKITMNSTPVGYDTANFNCSTHCHTEAWGNTNHNMEAASSAAWSTRGSSLVGPTLSCTMCHSSIYNAGTGTHIDADGPGTAFVPGTTDAVVLCTACHTQHAQASDTTAANKIIIPTRDGSSNPIPTMTNSGGTALYSSHGYKIWLGGNATSNTTYTTIASATTEAQMCWGCHEMVSGRYRTISGTNATFGTFTLTGTPVTIAAVTGTDPNRTQLITATGINTKFSVGDWVTIFDTAANVANQGRTFKVTATGTNTITVNIPQYEGAMTAVTNVTTVTVVSPVSEWQVNENSATGSQSYNYGMLFTTGTAGNYALAYNWTSATWRSGRGLNSGAAYNPAWYKRGTIKSTHTANPGVGTAALTGAANSVGYAGTRVETLDSVGNIRCTYCHDVHGTHDGVKGDPGGKPFLRGSWRGNPYPEDMAPRYGMTNFTVQSDDALASTYPYTANTLPDTNYGVVPRAAADPNNSGLATVRRVGGFWIDQNSGNPTASITGADALAKATNSSGLCEQCHGANKNGTWTVAALSGIDQTTAEGLWVSSFNGHANSVIGGSMTETGTNLQWNNTTKVGRNIFNRTVRGNAQMSTGSTQTGKVDHNMGAVGGSQGVTFRAPTTGYLWYPRVAQNTEMGTNPGPSSRPYAMNVFAWNGGTGRSTVNATGTVGLTQDLTNGAEVAHNAQANYHTFTCSKCHNPHASRLPKLMITNCLDANHNTWEDKSTLTGTALPTAGASPVSATYTGFRHSQWATAQNCHRLDARAVLSTGQSVNWGSGWNKITPWLEDTSPNATKTAELDAGSK